MNYTITAKHLFHKRNKFHVSNLVKAQKKARTLIKLGYDIVSITNDDIISFSSLKAKGRHFARNVSLSRAGMPQRPAPPNSHFIGEGLDRDTRYKKSRASVQPKYTPPLQRSRGMPDNEEDDP